MGLQARAFVFLSFFLFLLITCQPVSAQLPDRFGGWERKAAQAVTPARLHLLAGEDAALLREYGFDSGERREYSKENATLAVALWKLKDVTGSFGLFTFLREPGMTPIEAEDRIAAARDHWLMQRGVYVLDAAGARLSPEEAKLLLAGVPEPHSSEGILPSLPAYLPREDLVPQSSKFLLGPVAFERLEKRFPSSAIGFETGAEAGLAHYRMGGKVLRLLLVSYATPQLAAKKLQSFQELPALSDKEESQRVFIERKGSLLAFVLDAPHQVAAQTLLDRIRYESSVTWSEYIPTRRDNLAHLLLTVFSLAGFLLLFAFVAGISFGGLRILAKKFLPFPIFDRPSQVEIIQLHLSDK